MNVDGNGGPDLDSDALRKWGATSAISLEASRQMMAGRFNNAVLGKVMRRRFGPGLIDLLRAAPVEYTSKAIKAMETGLKVGSPTWTEKGGTELRQYVPEGLCLQGGIAGDLKDGKPTGSRTCEWNEAAISSRHSPRVYATRCKPKRQGLDATDDDQRLLTIRMELPRAWAFQYGPGNNDFRKLEKSLIDVAKTPIAPQRPAYTRDHLFLSWHEKEGLGLAKIRDTWDDLSDEQRTRVCKSACGKVGGEDPKLKNSGREVVKKAVQKARAERAKAGDSYSFPDIPV